MILTKDREVRVVDWREEMASEPLMLREQYRRLEDYDLTVHIGREIDITEGDVIDIIRRG
jgi:hypothetical protein